MKINTKALPFGLRFVARTSKTSLLRFAQLRASLAPTSVKPFSDRFSLPESKLEERDLRADEHRAVYAVDEAPGLAELYQSLLQPAGYLVRRFNHRASALAALKEDSNRPGLLITNYHGFSMPIDRFIQACRLIHPTLRILMASGYEQSAMRFSRVKPDRIIHKPFTPEELQEAVKAV